MEMNERTKFIQICLNVIALNIWDTSFHSSITALLSVVAPWEVDGAEGQPWAHLRTSAPTIRMQKARKETFILPDVVSTFAAPEKN
jgi:hypothetical protein